MAELRAKRHPFSPSSAAGRRAACACWSTPLGITTPSPASMAGCCTTGSVDHVRASFVGGGARDRSTCWMRAVPTPGCSAARNGSRAIPTGPMSGLRSARWVFRRPSLLISRALDLTAKIVGVSKDFALLARCEREMRDALAGEASVAFASLLPRHYASARQQRRRLIQIATLLEVPLAEIAVIGDGATTSRCSSAAGFSIAMGNAGPHVQQAADVVTDRNSEEGFANAVERFVLEPPPALAVLAGVRAW